MQGACKDVAAKFAAMDLNWWTCIPEEIIGPDLQAMRNLYASLKPLSRLSRDALKEWTGEEV
ncbi:MAG TPA: hypothetical protein VH988_11655 [Thermoanaerobaculia bacterium]|jgi:hypothetical protein|nr:hypothetical protein [Thermoanaerobaculia bacterium]